MTTIVEVRDLWKIYATNGLKVEAVRGLALTIPTGDFVAIVGPSGSGKSTLLHILGCLDQPTSGKIYFQGRDLTQLNDAERTNIRRHQIGFVFQTYNLLPTLTALENVEFQLRLQGVKRSDRRTRAKEILERVGLGERLHHLPRHLSGGEQQRVAIARALVKSPALVLADEPTGNLDSVAGASIIDLLAEFNAIGQTILLVTHDLELAQKARRIIQVRDGAIRRDETRFYAEDGRERIGASAPVTAPLSAGAPVPGDGRR